MRQKSRKKRAVVAGGAGLIGSYFCERLLLEGHRVLCVDNLITGRVENVQNAMSSPEFEFLEQDITKPLRLAGPVAYVVHTASPASPADYFRHPVETMLAGSTGTHNLLEMARAKGARFLLASTSEVYGDAAVHPQREDYFGNVNPVGPRAVYDEAKRFAEAMTMAYHRLYRLNTGIARIFNTYGPRLRPGDGRAVPEFITRALADQPLIIKGGGLQTRSFCYVTDLVEGLYRLLKSEVHLPVNLGNPVETKIIELAQRIIELTGSRSQIKVAPGDEDDPRRRRPDITHATSCLDWCPKVGFDQGLADTIAFFRAQTATPAGSRRPRRRSREASVRP